MTLDVSTLVNVVIPERSNVLSIFVTELIFIPSKLSKFVQPTNVLANVFTFAELKGGTIAKCEHSSNVDTNVCIFVISKLGTSVNDTQPKKHEFIFVTCLVFNKGTDVKRLHP